MKPRWLILSLTIGLLGNAVHAEEKKKDAPPDEKATIDAIIKAGALGEAHKKLSHFKGEWDLAVKMWMDPSKPATESKATAETKAIMGGRYFLEVIYGTFMGMKFEGLSLTGYDNVQKKYHSTWVDNFGTGISTNYGKLSADGKTFTFDTEEIDPTTGKKGKGRNIVKIVSADKHETTVFKTIDAGGKEMEIKVMEITYTRNRLATEKLPGVWVLEDGPGITPKGMVWEFGANGKMLVGMMVDGKPDTKESGTWSVNGDILSIRLVAGDKEGKARIRELTDDKLVLRDDDQPKNFLFKKLK